MTQEEKQLLLKDLCARLPYWIKGLHRGEVHTLLTIESKEGANACIQVDDYEAWFLIDDFKPYLRPMSSMTEEERLYFHRNSARVYVLVDEEKIITKPFYGYTIRLFDWLNAHHFDYHGLIEKGLALEAPDWIYKTE